MPTDVPKWVEYESPLFGGWRLRVGGKEWSDLDFSLLQRWRLMRQARRLGVTPGHLMHAMVSAELKIRMMSDAKKLLTEGRITAEESEMLKRVAGSKSTAKELDHFEQVMHRLATKTEAAQT